MSEQPVENPPPEGDPETWDEMAARVTSDVMNGAYAKSLALSFQSYINAGFTYDQSWALTLREHDSRMEYLTQTAVMNATDRLMDDDS